MKLSNSYSESVEAGLRHVGGHTKVLEDRAPEDHPLTFIEEERGSRDGCLGQLEMLHRARAILAWFGDHDLDAFKHECYVASKLMYIRWKEAEPPRFSRRPVGLSQAGLTCCSRLR